MPRKPPPESSVPGKNLPRGSRRNQLRRGHGSPPVLGEVPYELSTVAHSKECKRSPQQFIPAGFPLHNQLPTGTEDSAIPLTTPDMVRSGRVLQTSIKSPFKVGDNQRPERTGEVGGINCGGDMGVRRCLARSLTSLALPRTPKSANGPRSNSFRPDSPSPRPTSPETEDSAIPSHHTGRVLQTSVKPP